MLASALLALALVLAQAIGPASDQSVRQAKKHFELGHVHFRAGDYGEAVREFEAANGLRPHPIFLYDMGQAYRLGGDAARALEMYRAYLAAEPGAKNRKSVQGKIDALKVEILTAPQRPSSRREPFEVAPPDEEQENLAGLVAVLEVRSSLEGDAKRSVDIGYLADLVRGAALRAGPGIEVITRENLQALLSPAGKPGEACDAACEVESGRKAGADLIVTSILLRLGANYKLDLRLRDTRSGRLLATAVANAATVDELGAQAQEATRDLMRVHR